MIVYEVFTRYLSEGMMPKLSVESVDLFTSEDLLKEKYPQLSFNEFPYDLGTFYRRRIVNEEYVKELK